MINKNYIYIAIAVAIAFLAGLFVGVKYLAPALTTTNTVTNTIVEKPINITGTNTVDTKLQYVKGETVYLQSPASDTVLQVPVAKDTPNAIATKIDGKFDIGKPSFIYEVNGKVGKFTKSDDENFVLEKNMLDLKQSSTIKIQAEIPTIDLTRHNVLTVGKLRTDNKTSPAIGYTGSIGKIGAYQVVGGQNGQYVGIGVKF